MNTKRPTRIYLRRPYGGVAGLTLFRGKITALFGSERAGNVGAHPGQEPIDIGAKKLTAEIAAFRMQHQLQDVPLAW